MAIIKLAAPLSGLRGTIGGITYSANAATPYAKAWSKPARPLTQRQSDQQGTFSQLPTLWRALSSAQKTAWDTFAALPAQELTNSLGETYYASGANWFTKCNTRLLTMGRSTITATPTQARPAAPTLTYFQITPAGSDTNLATGGTATGSDTNPAFPASNAFDGSTTYANRWQTLTSTLPATLQYTLSSAANIKKLRLYYGSTFSDRQPGAITIQVYSGGLWRDLDTVSSISPTLDAWWEHHFANSYTETQYRIVITATLGAAAANYVIEMELYAADVDASFVQYPSGTFSASPDYDLVFEAAMSRSLGLIQPPSKMLTVLRSQSPDDDETDMQDEVDELFGAPLDNRAWFGRLYRQTTEGLRSTAGTYRFES